MSSQFKFLSLVFAASVLLSSVPQSNALAQDAYAGCTCISGPSGNSGGIGKIVSFQGEVLVNNLSASAGQILPAQSEIMVGSGSVAYKVGQTCADEASANTLVSISQPAGANSKLCVKVSSIYAAHSNTASLLQGGGLSSDGKAIMLAVLGAGAGVALIAAVAGGEKKTPASP